MSGIPHRQTRRPTPPPTPKCYPNHPEAHALYSLFTAPMNPDLEHLIVLQSQDLELRRLRQELIDAPIRVAAAQTARAKAEVALTNTKASLLKEEVLRRSQQTDVKDRQGKIARLRKQMETATSAAQIAALEHEINFSEQTIAKLEDEELASLERTDKLEISRGEATLLLEVTTATLAASAPNSPTPPCKSRPRKPPVPKRK